MTVEELAGICHGVNRALCQSLGDYSQTNWAMAPTWQKQSAINGVIFNLTHPDAPPSSSHENWLAEKRATGWKYGEVKDEEAKTHPCYVQYGELPVGQKAKDILFKATVGAFASEIDSDAY